MPDKILTIQQTQIEDHPVVGDELSREHLRLVSGGAGYICISWGSRQAVSCSIDGGYDYADD